MALSRVFIAFTVTFIGLWVMAAILITLTRFRVSFYRGFNSTIIGFVLLYESNAFKNISIFEVIIMFFIGGVFSLLSTMVLYRFVVFSDQFERFGSLTFFDAF